MRARRNHIVTISSIAQLGFKYPGKDTFGGSSVEALFDINRHNKCVVSSTTLRRSDPLLEVYE